jgi:hypothetical protein
MFDVFVTVHHQYSDVNNQQDATTISFINIFKSAPHVSGNKKDLKGLINEIFVASCLLFTSKDFSVCVFMLVETISLTN